MTTIEPGYPLLWLSRAPYGGSQGRSGLDVVLSFAVFAQEPEVLLTGEAILGLLPPDSGASFSRPSLRKVIDSLPLYDVERIWVDRAGLTRHNIDEDRLPDFARLVDDEDLRSLIKRAGAVLSL